MIGGWIRTYRLDQNMSQTSLCQGICAVSYLSKIETNQVVASHEIITLLFDRLGYDMPENPEAIEGLKDRIYEAIEALDHGHDQKAQDQFKSLEETFKGVDPPALAVDWWILKAHLFQVVGPYDQTDPCLKAIWQWQDYHTRHQTYHAYLLEGDGAMRQLKLDQAIRAYASAQAIDNTGLIKSRLANVYFSKGKFSSAVAIGQEAYRDLLDQGNLHQGVNVSLMVAAAYSNGGHIDEAIACYKRLLNLSEYTARPSLKASVYYNLGATYVMLRDFDRALPYLNQAYEVMDLSHDFKTQMLYQKMALSYIGQGQMDKARHWVSKLLDIDVEPGETLMSMTLCSQWLAYYLKDDSENQEGFLEALEATYKASQKDAHFGFQLFYGQYLMAFYGKRRHYKEAYVLSEALRLS